MEPCMFLLANAPLKRPKYSTGYCTRSVKPDCASSLQPSVYSLISLNPARGPPTVEGTLELFPGDPFPDYGMDPVMDYDACANG